MSSPADPWVLTGKQDVFRRHWSELDAHTCLTEAELTEASELVARGFTVLGEREQAPARLDDAALTRQRAFTLFVGAYAQTRRCVQFLRFHEKDAEELAPSLYSGRGNGNHRHTDEEPAEEAGASPIIASASGGVVATAPSVVASTENATPSPTAAISNPGATPTPTAGPAAGNPFVA